MSTALAKVGRDRKELELLGEGLRALGLLHSESLQSHHLPALPREFTACCY